MAAAIGASLSALSERREAFFVKRKKPRMDLTHRVVLNPRDGFELRVPNRRDAVALSCAKDAR